MMALNLGQCGKETNKNIHTVNHVKHLNSTLLFYYSETGKPIDNNVTK